MHIYFSNSNQEDTLKDKTESNMSQIWVKYEENISKTKQYDNDCGAVSFEFCFLSY